MQGVLIEIRSPDDRTDSVHCDACAWGDILDDEVFVHPILADQVVDQS